MSNVTYVTRFVEDAVYDIPYEEQLLRGVLSAVKRDPSCERFRSDFRWRLYRFKRLFDIKHKSTTEDNVDIPKCMETIRESRVVAVVLFGSFF